MILIDQNPQKDPQESYLLKENEPSIVDKTCARLERIMKKISNSTPDMSKYVLTIHLNDLKDKQDSNIDGIIKHVSSVIGIDGELFYTNGEEVKKKLEETLFPAVQPVADDELLVRADVLKKDLKYLKKMFQIMNEALNIEIDNMGRNYAFSTFNEPKNSYHTFYKKYVQTFAWVKRNFQEVTKSMKVRVESDQEKNAPITFMSRITPTIIYDKEQVRKDTLETLDFTYTMGKDQSSKDLNSFNISTDKTSQCFLELQTEFDEYKELKKSAKRKYCHMTYLTINGVRPNSRGDKFNSEYDAKVNSKEEKKHRYLKQDLREFYSEEKVVRMELDHLSQFSDDGGPTTVNHEGNEWL